MRLKYKVFYLSLITAMLCLGACGKKTAPEPEALTTEAPEPVALPAAETEQIDTEEVSETSETSEPREVKLAYRFASAQEGEALKLSSDIFFDNLSQSDIDFRLQKKNGTVEELKAFTAQQILDFTEEEKETVAATVARLEALCREKEIRLPIPDEIIFVRTTMAEEGDAAAYTHGTQIYLGEWILALMGSKDKSHQHAGVTFLAHELFHCLTRCNPEFRADLYAMIGFTIEPEDYVFPEEVKHLLISNPDVEHFNAHAPFLIHGEEKECVVIYRVSHPFEKAGDDMFALGQVCLVPVDDLSTVYLQEEAENFYDVFGRNTNYVIDPEEAMADNFSYAVVDGANGRDYETPEIIDRILAYLRR